MFDVMERMENIAKYFKRINKIKTKHGELN
jgi:hypothetical protein